MKPIAIQARMLFLALFAVISTHIAACQSKVNDAQPIPAFNAEARLSGSTMSFIVLGDWGSGLEPQRTVAEGMFKKHAKDPVVAVLTTGDNIYPDGVTSAIDELWDIRFESVYPVSTLPVPFWATLGNHDYHGNPDAQVAYHGKPLPDGSPHWHMPARYWSNVFQTQDGTVEVRITGIDTQMLVSGEKEDKKTQLAWLDSVLAVADEDWNIVIGHHPVYSNGQHGNTLSLIIQAKPLFEKHGVDAYFAGHDHDLQLLKPVNGVEYIVSGGGGKARSVWWRDNTQFAATNNGFVWVQFNKDRIIVQFLSPEGEVLFAYEPLRN